MFWVIIAISVVVSLYFVFSNWGSWCRHCRSWNNWRELRSTSKREYPEATFVERWMKCYKCGHEEYLSSGVLEVNKEALQSHFDPHS
jgi:hypothetical protein